jgi:uncharacterized membrane protein
MRATVFTEADRKRIAEAVKAAEHGHRGEIVVHVEWRSLGHPLKRAAKLWTRLGVDKTKEDTGVLLYVATSNRRAAVWSGKGVRDGDKVETWKPAFDALGKADTTVAGICNAVAAIGAILATHAAGHDTHGNELADGVST